MLEALKSFYADIRVCVDIPSVGRSAPFDTTMGVKQGCSMSPTLFGLYIDQLEVHLQDHAQDDFELQGQKVSILLYADDIVLLSKSPTTLQLLLHVLQLFYGEKLLSVNMSKTQVAILGHTMIFAISVQTLFFMAVDLCALLISIHIWALLCIREGISKQSSISWQLLASVLFLPRNLVVQSWAYMIYTCVALCSHHWSSRLSRMGVEFGALKSLICFPK